MTGKKTVAVIPARGGSTTIPKKNIKIFEGKPLIAWTIECALAAKGVDRIIVSTDNEEIANISSTYGAEVPFLRPAEISTADTAIEPVMAHAYEWFADKEDYEADALILLFPTNPLREVRHIEEALNLFHCSKANSVVSVNQSPAHYTPYWTLVRNTDGQVSYFNGQDIRMGYARRQDFPRSCFAKNDLVFVLRPQNLFESQPSLYGQRVELYITDRIYDGDINTPEDWELTLLTFQHLRSRSKSEGKSSNE
jgi:CMP-N,N'-diacetyllegionaminic acid synthase